MYSPPPSCRDVVVQVATDALVQMERAMARDKIATNDRQLACARISSKEGQNYLQAMAAAANYAWVNRTSMMFLTRQVRRDSALGGWEGGRRLSLPSLFHAGG